MAITKIFGWILLLVGLLIISWGLYSSYNIFTGKALPPEIFKTPKEQQIIPPQKGTAPSLEAQLEEKMRETITEQLKRALPVDYMPKLLNLISWSIFAGLLFFGGGQIASLGIKLLKK